MAPSALAATSPASLTAEAKEGPADGRTWETVIRRGRAQGSVQQAVSSSSKPDPIHWQSLQNYLNEDFDGAGNASFEAMWRRHAPPPHHLSGNWGYAGPKHKHSYEENPAAREAINKLLDSSLEGVTPGDATGRLVRERFCLPKEAVRELTRWILRAYAGGTTPTGFTLEADHVRLKIYCANLRDVREQLPASVQSALVRTDGRTGLTVTQKNQLVWEYGLRIILDTTGLRTVHSSGDQAADHTLAHRPQTE